MGNPTNTEREEISMKASKQNFAIEVEGMKAVCPLGEVVGKQMIGEKRIPVISCEGGCFRGEIARVAAHMVAKEEPYSRGCHGEMFTAPRSAMAEWARKANKVIVIDGCFMHCHGRIMKNIVGDQNVFQFDALPIYNKDRKYSDIMLVDEIPEDERKDLAKQVADKVLDSLRDGIPCDSTPQTSCGGERTLDIDQRELCE
jgi:uncharacterized metal-binding protein